MPTCRYHYDPLDRLAARTDSAQDSTRHFYQASRLATAIGNHLQRTILATDRQLLAQRDLSTAGERSHLLATDQQDSVLTAASAGQRIDIAYSPYGHRQDAGPLPGFNGQDSDLLTGHYLLGNGYRAYNSVLRRFNSPDSLSPFGEGGLNAYAYCHGDPVNRSDPGGHFDIGDFFKSAVPYIALLASAVGSTVLYKFTKVRFSKWHAGTATPSDKVVSVGTLGVIASAATVGTGSIVRLAAPDSDASWILMGLGTIGAIGFQSTRYVGYRLGKPVPAPIPKGVTPRRSLIERGSRNSVTMAKNIRMNL